MARIAQLRDGLAGGPLLLDHRHPALRRRRQRSRSRPVEHPVGAWPVGSRPSARRRCLGYGGGCAFAVGGPHGDRRGAPGVHPQGSHERPCRSAVGQSRGWPWRRLLPPSAPASLTCRAGMAACPLVADFVAACRRPGCRPVCRLTLAGWSLGVLAPSPWRAPPSVWSAASSWFPPLPPLCNGTVGRMPCLPPRWPISAAAVAADPVTALPRLSPVSTAATPALR